MQQERRYRCKKLYASSGGRFSLGHGRRRSQWKSYIWSRITKWRRMYRRWLMGGQGMDHAPCYRLHTTALFRWKRHFVLHLVILKTMYLSLPRLFLFGSASLSFCSFRPVYQPIGWSLQRGGPSNQHHLILVKPLATRRSCACARGRCHEFGCYFF